MAEPARSAFVVTAEHAGNRVPKRWAKLFAGKEQLLASHRGYDPGSLDLARRLARALDAPLVAHTVTRLLVEVNRMLGHRSLFSEITRPLPRDERKRIIARHYWPHRQRVRFELLAALQDAPAVVHLSIHTFTPVLHGETRNAEIGLLYDPKRPREKAFCRAWKQALAGEDAALRGADDSRRDAGAALRVRLNYPYRGAADGLTTALRRELPAGRYLGIELEVNQSLLPAPTGRFPASLVRTLCDTLMCTTT